ncbi:hypothetical protein AAVH_14318 [Aphelenchoides avenae]|nr:hypothetical protein AAVH_14318 [Aphelenchus avenae]
MDFAFEMLRQLNDAEKSVVLSPTSLAIALGACMMGADGKTLQQIKDILSKGKIERSASRLKCSCVKPDTERRVSASSLHAYFTDLIKTLKVNSTSSDCTLRVASQIYLNRRFDLLEAYIEKVDEKYEGRIQSVYMGDAEGTSKVQVPKFKTDMKTELAKTLENLGMVDAFLEGRAEFSKMFDASVDESGTTGAAATLVIIRMCGMMGGGGSPPPPPEFIADHPFVYALVTYRGDILFLGIFRG